MRVALRGPRSDAGASLLMALALTTFLGLVFGALLSYGSVSIRAAKAADTLEGRSYGTDGALEIAVNQVRNSTFNNDPGSSCPDRSVPAADGPAMRVTCTARPGTGGGSETVPISPANRPGQAVLTLGANTGRPGIAQSGSGTLRVQGTVFSSGPIAAGTGSVESVDARVTARGACTGTVISRDALGTPVSNACSAPAGDIPADPDYAQPTAGLTYRPLPTCDRSSTVEFQPGYYDDAVGLSDMMDGGGACAGKTFLFAPASSGVGVYYFDFHNGEGGGLPTGAHVWTVDDADARVVGGTPVGWTPDSSAPSIPGACVSPLRSTTGAGVRFVFGGDSRMRVRSGQVELCGQYSASSPPVTMQGAKTGADPGAGPSTLTTDGTGTNPTDGPAFADPSRITVTDGVPASAVVDSRLVLGGVTASVVVQDFAPPSPVPAGSVLTGATLLVVHRDNNADTATAG